MNSYEQIVEDKHLDEMIEQHNVGAVGRKLRVVDQWANVLWESPDTIDGHHVNHTGEFVISIKGIHGE